MTPPVHVEGPSGPLSASNGARVDTILHGDALATLRNLPSESVHCIVTSPPYWGLRDYGTAKWEGGDPACDHLNGPLASPKSKLGNGRGVTPQHKTSVFGVPFKGALCGKCGARRRDAQLGLEETPAEYVAHMVEVFREARRVLRADGTLWLNLGDSYAGSWGNYAPGGIKGKQRERSEEGKRWERRAYDDTTRKPATADVKGLKPKDLVGIPWRVAFALQADGWWLRSDIIWQKPNCMPESVRDRPTKSHEYVFLLTKSERYYYDADAIMEPATEQKARRYGGEKNVRLVEANKTGLGVRTRVVGERPAYYTRNKRTVWSVPTRSFSGAHFAVMPPALVEPCVLAGCPAGGVVLDPFMGAGTVGVVAKRHSRHYLGIELNAEYIALAEARIAHERQPVLWSAGMEVSA